MKTKFRLLEHVDVDSITRDMTDEEIKKKQEFMEALRQSCDFATYKVYSECLEGVPLYLYYPDDREIKEGDYDLGLTSLDSFGNKKIIINGDLLDDFDDYVIEPTEEDPEGASIYDPKDKKLHVTGMMIAVMIFKHEMLHIFLEHLIRTEAKFQKWYVENYPNDPKGGSYHFLSAEKWRLIGNYAGDWDLSRYYLPAELELTRKGHLRIYGDKLKLLALEFDRPEWFNSKPPLTLEQLLEKILESKDEVITEVEKGKLPPVWKNANLNPPRSAEEKRKANEQKQEQENNRNKPPIDPPGSPTNTETVTDYGDDIYNKVKGHFDSDGNFVAVDKDGNTVIYTPSYYDEDKDIPKKKISGVK